MKQTITQQFTTLFPRSLIVRNHRIPLACRKSQFTNRLECHISRVSWRGRDDNDGLISIDKKKKKKKKGNKEREKLKNSVTAEERAGNVHRWKINPLPSETFFLHHLPAIYLRSIITSNRMTQHEWMAIIILLKWYLATHYEIYLGIHLL